MHTQMEEGLIVVVAMTVINKGHTSIVVHCYVLVSVSDGHFAVSVLLC